MREHIFIKVWSSYWDVSNVHTLNCSRIVKKQELVHSIVISFWHWRKFHHSSFLDLNNFNNQNNSRHDSPLFWGRMSDFRAWRRTCGKPLSNCETFVRMLEKWATFHFAKPTFGDEGHLNLQDLKVWFACDLTDRECEVQILQFEIQTATTKSHENRPTTFRMVRFFFWFNRSLIYILRWSNCSWQWHMGRTICNIVWDP